MLSMIELSWIQEHWFDVLEAIGVISTLLFGIRTVREELKIRKLECGFRLTKHHREIWSELYRHPELSRVLETKIDLEARPMTEQERLFVRFVILHTKNAYTASRAGFYSKLEELKKDITDFLSLPIPSAVWFQLGSFQEADFQRFVAGSVQS